MTGRRRFLQIFTVLAVLGLWLQLCAIRGYGAEPLTHREGAAERAEKAEFAEAAERAEKAELAEAAERTEKAEFAEAAEKEAAAGEAETADIPGQEDWEALDEFLLEQYQETGEPVTFSGLVQTIMDGDAGSTGKMILQGLKQAFLSEISRGGHMAGQLLALGLIGAMFAGFSDIFSGGGISEAGFFMTYLAAFSVMSMSFLDSVVLAGELIETQISFMKALIPSYFLVVAWSGASVAAMAWHELILILIAGIQWLYGTMILPGVRIFVLISMTGNMMKEDMFSKMAEFLKSGISWGTRSLIGVVLGFQLIQGMVLPYADAVKNTGVQKAMQMIPGIGQGAASVAKMLLGSAVLIKNSMGAAAALVLILLSVIPLVKLAVLLFLYRAAAALIQPVADKRLTACISSAGDGQKMLLDLVFSVLVLFLITLALICTGTNVSYLA